jgi:hypothetical protein
VGSCGSRADREHMHKGALLDAAAKKPRKTLIEGSAAVSTPPGKGQSRDGAAALDLAQVQDA